MAWIRMIPEDAAEGDLAELYERYREPHGGVDNVLRVHSLCPRSLEAHYDLYRAVMTGTRELRRVKREMIAVVVSALNRCHY
jgi:alkylhydroperoxidase family enzyme